MGRYVLGIDLGTVNSCVAVVKDGKAVVLGDGNDNRIPSCLAISRGKEVVGKPARRHALIDPHNTISAVKRLIGHAYDSAEVQSARSRSAYPIRPSPLGDVLLAVGGVELTPIQVSARILARVKEVAESALGTPVDSAVISVPAHFNDVQRKATKLAAEYAGLRVLRLVNEPTAAAFAYGYRKGRDFTLAVYDLGGGTFDITIMSARGDTFEVRATDGDSYLGGEDVDHAIEEWLIREFRDEFSHDLTSDAPARLRLREAAEKAKVELSQVEQTQVVLPFVVQLPDGSRPPFERTLSRAKLEELCEALVQRTIDLCRRCMDKAGIPVAAIDEVLMVGGQSRMPAVRKAVALFFGKEPRRDINPDEVVAMGAALYAYSLSADRLSQEEEEDAQDQFAIAVKQTAIVTKLLTDVQQKLEQSKAPADAGLRSRLSSLIGDLSAAAAEAGAVAPAQPPPGTANTVLGKPPPGTADTVLDRPPAPASAKPAATSAKPAATEWERREFDFGGDDGAPLLGDDSIANQPKLKETALPTKRAPEPKPAAEAKRAQPKPAPEAKAPPQAKTAAPAKPSKSAPEPKGGLRPAPEALPTSIAKIRQKLSGMGDIAQEALDALAEEIAAEAGADPAAKRSREAEQLSAQLQASMVNAQRASEAAESHMEIAKRHAGARRVQLRDVTSHSLGVGAASDLMSVLIQHNTAIPVESERIFTTQSDGQTEVDIRVYQGRDQRASKNQLLGSFILQGIPPVRRMEPQIAVCFRIDENGILSVSAVDKGTGLLQSMRIEDPLGLQQAQPESEGQAPQEPSA